MKISQVSKSVKDYFKKVGKNYADRQKRRATEIELKKQLSNVEFDILSLSMDISFSKLGIEIPGIEKDDKAELNEALLKVRFAARMLERSSLRLKLIENKQEWTYAYRKESLLESWLLRAQTRELVEEFKRFMIIRKKFSTI